jgi:type I restriction enzyme S subunit
MSITRYEAYKDSEVEWLGDVPTHWEIIRNKDIFEERGSLSSSGDEILLTVSHITGVTRRSEKNVNMFMAETMEGYKHCKEGDLIINTMWAWMGALGTANEAGICSPAYGVYKPKKYIPYNRRFFDYLYRTPNAITEMTSKSKGIVSSRLRLYPKDFFQIQTALPVEIEQIAIAHYLDTKTAQIDQKIDLLSQKAAQYGKLKQSLINETVTRGLDETVPMKDSGVEWIGEVPVHWNMCRLKELSTIQNSNVDKKSHDNEIPVQLCNYVDVYKNDFIDASLNFMWASADESEIKRFTIKKNDVLITKDSETCDDIAIPALATESIEGVLCGYHLAQFRVKDKVLAGAYLFRLFQSKSYGFRFVISAKGITRVGLGQSVISDSLTPVPTLQEQQAIATYLDEKTTHIDRIVSTINTQIDKLKELRKALINDVVTGKICVLPESAQEL